MGPSPSFRLVMWACLIPFFRSVWVSCGTLSLSVENNEGPSLSRLVKLV